MNGKSGDFQQVDYVRSQLWLIVKWMYARAKVRPKVRQVRLKHHETDTSKTVDGWNVQQREQFRFVLECQASAHKYLRRTFGEEQ